MLQRGSGAVFKRLATITEVKKVQLKYFSSIQNGPFITRGFKSQEVKMRNVHNPDIVPLKSLKWEEPVSGSLEYGDMGKARKFEWDAMSLNARGFLRFQKPYTAPDNAEEIVLTLAKSTIPKLNKAGGTELMSFELKDARVKYEFLSRTFIEFNHSVPNSMLYLMNTIGDVVKFYNTNIKTATPYDELVKQKDSLPPNLHVQKEPLRFDPDTDTHFGGMTAFPKSSNIITGLRAKKKYKGYEAKKSWP